MDKGVQKTIDDLSMQILADIVADFRQKNLDSDALNEEYVGASIVVLEEKYCTDEAYSKIDFDLALKQLEENELVGTGPTVPYENQPDSGVFVLGFRSKREFVCLTEKGYKAAQKSKPKRSSSVPTVHISGGNFHHSPIGVGNTVHQTMTFNDPKSINDLRYLVETFEKHIDELTLDATSKRKATAQISTIKAQLEDEPDAVIVMQAGRTLRNITEGAIGSLIATATQPAVWTWVSQHMPKLFG